MIKPVLILCHCLIYWTGVNTNQAFNRKSSAAIQVAAAPILWTADYSPDGKLYAVGGNDHSLRVFEASSNKLLHSFKLSAAVQCLDWHTGSRLLAIGLDAKPVQILNITTLKFQQLTGTTGSRALDWNHDGALLAIGDYENTLQVWSREGQLLKLIRKGENKTYLSVHWHPAKNIILTGSDKIRIFDTSGALLQSIKHRHEETPVLSVRWHPGGKFFATGDYGENENKIESLLQFWNEDGILIRTLHGSKAEYRNIRWNKNGEWLATASDVLRLWSKKGEVIYSGSAEGLLWGIDWGNQDNTVVTTSSKGSIKIWNHKAKLLKQVEY